MTKKDQQAIARALYSAREDTGITEQSPQRDLWILTAVITNVANVMAAGNGKFDRERFVEACTSGR